MPLSFDQDGASGASQPAPQQGGNNSFGVQQNPAGQAGWALASAGGGSMINNGTGQTYSPGAANLPVGEMNSMALMFEDGGEVPDAQDDDTPDIADPNDQNNPSQSQGATNPTSGVSDQLGDRIALALSTVDSALSYGRKLNGLPGDSGNDEGPGQQASNMPMVPGTQSESGQRTQPDPGPLPPTSNPFGQRTVRPPLKMSANMPAQPAGQSESGIPPSQPGPGSLPATSNPFGKRTVRPPLQMSEATPQIPEDDDEEAS